MSEKRQHSLVSGVIISFLTESQQLSPKTPKTPGVHHLIPQRPSVLSDGMSVGSL